MPAILIDDRVAQPEKDTIDIEGVGAATDFHLYFRGEELQRAILYGQGAEVVEVLDVLRRDVIASIVLDDRQGRPLGSVETPPAAQGDGNYCQQNTGDWSIIGLNHWFFRQVASFSGGLASPIVDIIISRRLN